MCHTLITVMLDLDTLIIYNIDVEKSNVVFAFDLKKNCKNSRKLFPCFYIKNNLILIIIIIILFLRYFKPVYSTKNFPRTKPQRNRIALNAPKQKLRNQQITDSPHISTERKHHNRPYPKKKIRRASKTILKKENHIKKKNSP